MLCPLKQLAQALLNSIKPYSLRRKSYHVGARPTDGGPRRAAQDPAGSAVQEPRPVIVRPQVATRRSTPRVPRTAASSSTDLYNGLRPPAAGTDGLRHHRRPVAAAVPHWTRASRREQAVPGPSPRPPDYRASTCTLYALQPAAPCAASSATGGRAGARALRVRASPSPPVFSSTPLCLSPHHIGSHHTGSLRTYPPTTLGIPASVTANWPQCWYWYVCVMGVPTPLSPSSAGPRAGASHHSGPTPSDLHNTPYHLPYPSPARSLQWLHPLHPGPIRHRSNCR